MTVFDTRKGCRTHARFKRGGAHTAAPSFGCKQPPEVANGISPLFPILAAQQETYIVQQLKKLRQRDRSDPHAQAFMWGISRGLTDEQIENIAQYFSTQSAAPSPSLDSALAQKGKEIYENPLQLESGAVNLRELPPAARRG
jgi:cytochrome c553